MQLTNPAGRFREITSGINLKTAGLYLVAILVIFRFILLPLDSSINNRAVLLNEHTETYRARLAMLERQGGQARVKGKNKASEEEDKKVIESLYPKDLPYTVIQSEMLMELMKEAEKEGLTVFNFELAEIAPGEALSEVSVVLRLNGFPQELIKFMGLLEKLPKKISLRAFQADKNAAQFLFTLTLTAYRVER